ncbi:hypothetical protein SCB71_14535 [Herbiconiux sp. KACC 21604]|uniref:hypothetical protein n=1 Tax=unclassified Herbiconiux TaxID=2618217 RepID=UPI001490BDE5|nr:hypothetical protein [Herbiconiux sp. SALV-R1]QJU54360.1 hypothetical protein HL652_12475 [Herbiconiux sp. SALV-R1]WPO85430.1 hypothetical protein SCB71_14535 [Herbiconiux sp. KACC 21604]
MSGRHAGDREQLVWTEVMDDEHAGTPYQGFQSVCAEHGVTSRNHLSESSAHRLARSHLADVHIDYHEDITFRRREETI